MDKLNNAEMNWVNETFKKIDNKLQKVSVKSFNKIPYTTIDGVHDDKATEGIDWWTNGFWPGLMWLMYLDTKNEQYKKTAENAELMLDGALADYEKLHHDVGFMWHISSGVNFRVTGNKKSLVRESFAANVLAGRFNPAGKFIRAWNGDENKGKVIIDSMMNIPLLYWASEYYDDDRFYNVATQHADTLMRTHIRPDGSSNHIVRLESMTGDIIENIGGQGYGEGSSWSRGQAWALYGYVLSYIHTKDEKYLNVAKSVANYFITCVSTTDYLSLADFRAPAEPYRIDTTADACAACGMIELARVLPDDEGRIYLQSALKILHALEGQCNWSDDEDSILQNGMECYHNRPEIPIIYGDFFFTEAFYKLRGNELLFW